jgi:AraC-like DNA-binding protein
VANNHRELANPGRGVDMTETSRSLLVTARGDTYQGAVLSKHHHSQHIVAWSATATVTVRTDTRDWLVPPTHGLWLPADTPHSIEVLRQGHGYAIFFDVAHCPITWAEPTGVLITPLIRELISYLDQHPHHDQTRAHAEALLLALLEPTPSTTFHVPLPEDPRTRMIADALIANPADGRDLATWARAANAGVRTITRLFANETGMTFAQWRARVRVRAALTHLAQGTSVGATARAVGYRKPGAFSEAFHRVTGQHPGIYSSSVP